MLRAMTMIAASALALGGISTAQDAMTLSGQVDETFGEDGFVLVYGDTDIAVATGQLYDDNPGLRLRAGDQVTVYALPTAEFFGERIVDADGVAAGGAVYRVSASALDDSVYERPAEAEAEAEPRSARDTLAARRAARDGERREPGGKAAQREKTGNADAFADYDRNGDGVVTMSEYVGVATKSSDLTRSQAARLFEALARGDRLVTKKDYREPSKRYARLAERYAASE